MNEPISTGRADSTAGEHELVSVLIEYDERPDQYTIYPPDASGVARMSRWISADVDCFVDCEAMR